MNLGGADDLGPSDSE